MRGLFGALRQGWKTLWRPEAPVPFEVACGCGQVHRGLRAGRGQVVRCAGCGGALFVFPRSPLPPVQDRRPAAPRRSPWRLPVVAACVTLAIVVAVYVLVFSTLLRAPDHLEGNPDRAGRVPTLRESLEDGRALLAAGNFHQASELLSDACKRHPRDAELRQLHRQAELLTLLVHNPLEKIIEEGQMVGNAAEWDKRFRRDYQGRSVVFDDLVVRGPNGEYQLQTYEVGADDERALVKLDLDLFGRLPLDRPRRVLFGARLASVAREGGVWVIRFERDSGVLLTDEGAASACGLAPLDAELREVLRQQDAWVKGKN